MTTEIKLPPLPELGEYITIWERILEWDNEPKAGTRALALSDKVDDEITATLQAYATAAIKADRAQRGEPVLWRYRDSEQCIKPMDGYTPGEGWTPLYAAPQPERKPMTPQQILDLIPDDNTENDIGEWIVLVVRGVEKFHDIKETT